MFSVYHFLTPRFWKDYELIDCGNFEKLERFGEMILARPEPQAIWKKKLSEKEWDTLSHARYVREKGRETTLISEKGNWFRKKGKEKWTLNYTSENLNLNFNLSLTAFGHIGIFPEQAENWEYIFEHIKKLKVAKPKVLNLFAYTGGASLAACAAGAEVVHVDAVKQTVNWANENKMSSNLNGSIRWMIDDAVSFVKREVRRGNKYHGIILDPPAYGRGPAGEKWLLERDLNGLVHDCLQLLGPQQNFFLLNIYSIGFSALILHSLIKSFAKNANCEIGELVLRSKNNIDLPAGTFLRF